MTTEFRTSQEYQSFILQCDMPTEKISELSSDGCEYIYIYNINQIAYFNYNKNKGWATSYSIAQNQLSSQSIDLRRILTKQTVGIQYSRINYLEADDSLFMSFDANEHKYMSILIKLYGKDISFKEMFASDDFLNNLSIKLSLMDKEEVMKYELPLLFLFVDYAKKTYSNSIQAIKVKSFLKEEYKAITIKSKHGNIIYLSDMLFRVLFPEYGREDYIENEDDRRITLTILKSYLDYHNSDKVFQVWHE
ncbi:hypothetical protein [Thermoflexibacter ruber]|nr:hypothetical protein [Thermoflexibacter ruber]